LEHFDSTAATALHSTFSALFAGSDPIATASATSTSFTATTTCTTEILALFGQPKNPTQIKTPRAAVLATKDELAVFLPLVHFFLID
jgi:hypothetical protein